MLPRRAAIVAESDRERLSLSLPQAAPVFTGVVIDTRPPRPFGRVEVPNDGACAAGQSLDFVVSFTEAVIIGGTPHIALTGDRRATFVAGSGFVAVHASLRRSGRGRSGLRLGKSIALSAGGKSTDEAGNSGPRRIDAVPMRRICVDDLLGAASRANAAGSRTIVAS